MVITAESLIKAPYTRAVLWLRSLYSLVAKALVQYSCLRLFADRADWLSERGRQIAGDLAPQLAYPSVRSSNSRYTTNLRPYISIIDSIEGLDA
jgi:hypothetical protein